MSELAGRMMAVGEALPGWVAGMTITTGALLLVAVALDRLLAPRVSAGVRLLPYLAVVVRVGLPVHWQAPLGVLGRAAAAVRAPVARVSADSVPTSVRFGVWVAAGYLMVAAVLLGRWVAARWSLSRALRTARPARASVGALVHDLRVLEHATLGPVAVGVLRPRVVVPEALADDPESLAWVLRHEEAHLRRRDPILVPAVQLAAIAVWPLVPVWLAVSRVRALIELACDERALRAAGGADRRRYGEVLLAMAAGDLMVHRPAVVSSFGWALHGRLRALAFRRRWARLVQVGLVTGVAAAAFACAGGPDVDEPLAGEQRGELDPALVVGAVRGRMSAVKRCYEQMLKGQREGGRLVARFTIGPSGTVTAAAIGGSTLGPHGQEMERCVLSVIRGLKVPPPKGGPLEVEFPFVFQASD
jgi:TonB family protein